MGRHRVGQLSLLLSPVLAMGLISLGLRVFNHPMPGDSDAPEYCWLVEGDFAAVPVFLMGAVAALWGARREQPALATYSLVPLWGTVAVAMRLAVEQAAVIDTNCGPASRETILVLRLGQLYGVLVLALAWSSALSLSGAVATLANRDRHDTGPAISLLLAGFAFASATLQAGAIRMVLMASPFVDIPTVQAASERSNVLGGLAGVLMIISASVAFSSNLQLVQTPARAALVGALTVVPLLCWGFAIETREPLLELMRDRLPRALIVDGLAPLTQKPAKLGGWETEADVAGGIEEYGAGADGEADSVFSLQVSEEISSASLWRVFEVLESRGVFEVELQGTAGGIRPLPLDAIERRVAFSPSATRVRLMGDGPCNTCDVKVSFAEDDLLVDHEDGSIELWKRASLLRDADVSGLSGAEWDGTPPENQALVAASLVALSHGHILTLRLR